MELSVKYYPCQLAEFSHSHNYLIFTVIVHCNQNGALWHTEMVHYGVPKWCIMGYRNSALYIKLNIYICINIQHQMWTKTDSALVFQDR
ncbi:MAG: hypothetical protein WCR36_12210, partial [Bacteroidaceae bacterium]